MPDSTRMSLTVLKEVHNKAMDRYTMEFESKKTKLSFIKWLSEYILLNLEKDEFLTEYAPFLENIGITDNRITIRDSKKDKLTDIFFKEGHPYCNLDESETCEHVQFAMALPELAKLKNNS